MKKLHFQIAFQFQKGTVSALRWYIIPKQMGKSTALTPAVRAFHFECRTQASNSYTKQFG